VGHAHFRHAVIPHIATMTLTQVSTGVPELSNTLIDRWSASLLRKRTGPPVHDQQTNGPQPLGLTGDAHVMSYCPTAIRFTLATLTPVRIVTADPFIVTN